jgi:glycerate 2-kinase
VQAAVDAGLDAYSSILTRPCTLAEALTEARELLMSSAEQTMRLLLVGRRLAWQEAEATAAWRRPALGKPALGKPALAGAR